MRAGLRGLSTPHPIGERLPAVYLDDDFTQRFVAALDEVLAPMLLTLDSFPAYLDPRLTPEDFLTWLAGWVAFTLDESWPVPKRRELVAHAVELHRRRGTRKGLAWQVELITGGEVEVVDSGSCGWTDRPGEPVPGADSPRVTVRVRPDRADAVDPVQLRAAVAEMVPAHVRVDVEIVDGPLTAAQGEDGR